MVHTATQWSTQKNFVSFYMFIKMPISQQPIELDLFLKKTNDVLFHININIFHIFHIFYTEMFKEVQKQTSADRPSPSKVWSPFFNVGNFLNTYVLTHNMWIKKYGFRGQALPVWTCTIYMFNHSLSSAFVLVNLKFLLYWYKIVTGTINSVKFPGD